MPPAPAEPAVLTPTVRAMAHKTAFTMGPELAVSLTHPLEQSQRTTVSKAVREEEGRVWGRTFFDASWEIADEEVPGGGRARRLAEAVAAAAQRAGRGWVRAAERQTPRVELRLLSGG